MDNATLDDFCTTDSPQSDGGDSLTTDVGTDRWVDAIGRWTNDIHDDLPAKLPMNAIHTITTSVPQLSVESICDTFEMIRPILRPEGSAWVHVPTIIPTIHADETDDQPSGSRHRARDIQIALEEHGWTVDQITWVWQQMPDDYQANPDTITRASESLLYIRDDSQSAWFDRAYATSLPLSTATDVIECPPPDIDTQRPYVPPELFIGPTAMSTPPTVCADCGHGYDPTHDPMENVHPRRRQFEQQCDCETDETATGVILDPFAGKGTILRSGRDHGYRVIGLESDPTLRAIGQDRLGLPLDEPERLFEANPVTESW